MQADWNRRFPHWHFLCSDLCIWSQFLLKVTISPRRSPSRVLGACSIRISIILGLEFSVAYPAPTIPETCHYLMLMHCDEFPLLHSIWETTYKLPPDITRHVCVKRCPLFFFHSCIFSLCHSAYRLDSRMSGWLSVTRRVIKGSLIHVQKPPSTGVSVQMNSFFFLILAAACTFWPGPQDTLFDYYLYSSYV